MKKEVVDIIFVCHGNICRSTMAEQIARNWAEQEGFTNVAFDSAAVSTEEHGNPIDRRAAKVLTAHGYPVGNHQAHRITAVEVARADLIVCMETYQKRTILSLFPKAKGLCLLSDFDPSLAPGAPIVDPWYGPASGFEDTLTSIENAMPGLMEHIEHSFVSEWREN